MSVLHESRECGGRELPKILVVDDEQLQREQLAAGLSDLNVGVLQAGNGAEALTMIDAHRPGLVIMDIRMPVLDGVEAVDRLSARGSNTKIILVTGDPDSLRAAHARRPQVFTIIEKPIPLRILRRFVIEALAF